MSYLQFVSAFIISLFSFMSFLYAGQTKTLDRKIDPLILKGKDCVITGKAPADYGLYAVNKGRLIPVPFQIDEVDNKGVYVLTGGKDKGRDDDSSFDANDELVFMSLDTGDRIAGDSVIPANAAAGIELEITDPVSFKKGWVYLFAFDSPQPLSQTDYVSYDPGKMLVTARNYLVEFNPGHPVAGSRYAFWTGLGGSGIDILDRVKVRIFMKLGFITLNRSENDIKVTEYGFIDGPVRVITHTRNVTPLILGIPASSTVQDTVYYYTHADFPFAVKFPIKPGEFHVKIIDDMINISVWKFYSDRNPAGHVFDGKMDESDKKLDLSEWKWSVHTNEKFGFWTRWFAPSFSTVKVNLYYNDDINYADPMEDSKVEDSKGESPATGYDFSSGWTDLKKDLIEFRLVHYFTTGYRPGMEKEVTNVHDRPLTVSARKVR